ncbi:MAG: hypothetical protein WCK32_03715 [Chlorobiaceae bacterium]
MAQEKKGGFFSAFKKRIETDTPTPKTAQAQPQFRSVAIPESIKSSVGQEQSKAVAVAKPAAVSASSSEPVIDTVAAFTVLCQAIVDIGESQLKMVDLALKTLAGSINKLADVLKPK